MSDVVRAVGYIGGLQRLAWSGPSIQMQAYLWGGGGGGGGRDGSGAQKNGGNGTGGAYSEINLALNAGDILDVAVAQGGGGGVSAQGSAAGGPAGQSLLFDLFDSRNATGAIAQTNGAWSPFMNAHAVWDAGDNTYNYSETINFPYTGYYTFTYAVDEQLTVTLDGSAIITFSGFRDNPPVTSGILVTAGNHVLAWTALNFTSARGIALTITASFSGGNGSAAGPRPFSGGGGGGGGATALFKNNELIAIAGGGGGGGGGGRSLGASPNAPGPNGVTLDGVFAGQNGQSKSGDGGGAGGGGGGYAGGQGGSVQGGDTNGLGGSAGRGLGTVILSPNQRTPGGSGSQYYAGSSRGGNGDVGTGPATTGQNGYAVFVLQIPGIFIRSNAEWVPVQNLYLRQNNSWQLIENNYVRSGDSWRPVRGASAPIFNFASSTWGRSPRPNS
jgi:hypothetical protein